MLEFERTRDTAGHVEQVKREVSNLEESLQKCQKNEKKYRKVGSMFNFNHKLMIVLKRLSKIFNKKYLKLKIV